MLKEHENEMFPASGYAGDKNEYNRLDLRVLVIYLYVYLCICLRII